LYFEKSLNFKPIYSYLANFKGKDYTFSRIFWDTHKTKTGLLNNGWVVGPSLFWIPSLFVMNVFFGRWIGPYTPLMELGPAITGILLMIASLYLIGKTLRRFYSEFTVQLTLLIIFFGTPVFYYTAFEPALSHQPAIFLISFLFYLCFQKRKKGIILFILGFLIGLLAITRPVDILIGISLLVFFITQNKLPFYRLLLALSGLLISIAPQLMVQHALYGNMFINEYYFNVPVKFIFSVSWGINSLFGPQRGLFLWHPVFFISCVGLYLLTKQHNKHPIPKLTTITFILFFIMISLWSGSSSAGFGNRFYLSALPFFAFGLAHFFTSIPRKFVTYISILFIIWNMLLLGQFVVYKKRMVNGVGNSSFRLLTGQIEIIPDILNGKIFLRK